MEIIRKCVFENLFILVPRRLSCSFHCKCYSLTIPEFNWKIKQIVVETYFLKVRVNFFTTLVVCIFSTSLLILPRFCKFQFLLDRICVIGQLAWRNWFPMWATSSLLEFLNSKILILVQYFCVTPRMQLWSNSYLIPPT